MSKVDPNEYPKALYRPAEADSGHPVHEIWGHRLHMITVENAEQEAAEVKAGWSDEPPAEKTAKDFKTEAKPASAKAAA